MFTTPEQRRERLDQLGQQLEAGIAAVQSSDQFKAYLRTAAKFHHYSHNNVILIICQCPQATRVAGYNAWKALGRQVRKGETAIRILAPITRRIDDATEADGDRYVVAFKAAPVFDISQTDGEPLPDVDVPTLDGDADAATYAALCAFADTHSLIVTDHDPHTDGDDTRSTYQGYYSPGQKLIFVKRNAPAQMLKTLVHELAHHLDPELKQAESHERETVAEAAAFMVAAHADLDTSAYSFPYIATWAGAEDGRDILKCVMQRTQQIAHQLIAAIDAAKEAQAEPII
jgi:antirestriction protein ArdC